MQQLRLANDQPLFQVRAEVAKGGKDRVVPVPKQAREALQGYLEDHPADDSGVLFMGRQGPLSVEGVAAVVTKRRLSDLQEGAE